MPGSQRSASKWAPIRSSIARTSPVSSETASRNLPEDTDVAPLGSDATSSRRSRLRPRGEGRPRATGASHSKTRRSVSRFQTGSPLFHCPGRACSPCCEPSPQPRTERGNTAMNRRSTWAPLPCGRSGGPGHARAGPDPEPRFCWRLASSFPKNLDILYGGSEYLAKRVAQMTENRFQIRTFAAGEILPALQVLDGLQTGTVECGQTASLYYVGKDPTFAAFTAIPFGMNMRQMSAWLRHGGGNEIADELDRDYNVVGIPFGDTGVQMGRPVPQGDPQPRGLGGPQIPHLRLRRAPVRQAGRRVEPQIAGPEILPIPRARDDRRGGVDRARRRREPRLRAGRQARIPRRAGVLGGILPRRPPRRTSAPGTACPTPTSTSWRSPAARPRRR